MSRLRAERRALCAWRRIRASFIVMGKRRADASHRRFTDEFPSVRVSRFRANGTIDPAKRTAIIAFPDGSTKLIGVGHTHLKYGGGWSFFICHRCTKLAQTLYSIDDKPLCWRCCDKLNIRHRGKWGMGREERMRAADLHLDLLIAKLETREPLRLNGAPASWGRQLRRANSMFIVAVSF
jgi:hypothetical protein